LPRILKDAKTGFDKAAEPDTISWVRQISLLLVARRAGPQQFGDDTMTIAAVFDLDGTLYTGHIWRGIWQHHQTFCVKRLHVVFYVGSHLLMWPLWRVGLLPDLSVRERWALDMGWTIRGWSAERAQQAFRWIAEKYVRPRERPDLVARLREHQAAGHRVILVSGTQSPLLAEIGRLWDVSETVGTPLVLANGRYNGRSLRPACQGVGKVTRLKEYLEATAPIDWEASFGYADSYTDIPLLEAMGRPVAVYPDEQLSDRAQAQSWEIIDAQ
jgi:HAD superfamily hydrolase (TIGR01490 family)